MTLLGIAGWGIGMRATTSKGLPTGEAPRQQEHGTSTYKTALLTARVKHLALSQTSVPHVAYTAINCFSR